MYLGDLEAHGQRVNSTVLYSTGKKATTTGEYPNSTWGNWKLMVCASLRPWGQVRGVGLPMTAQIFTHLVHLTAWEHTDMNKLVGSDRRAYMTGLPAPGR